MTVVDFIDVIDDIIDLSSDDETLHQDHNATQFQAKLLHKPAVFVLAGEERQDEQAAFLSAGEGTQEAAESANALVATISPSVMQKVPLDTAEMKSYPSSLTSAPLPSLTSTTPKAVTSEVGDTQLVCTASPSVMQETPIDRAEARNCPISPTTARLPSPVLTSDVGDTKLSRVKHPIKNYYTSTRRSRGFEKKRECHDNSMEEPAADHKRSRMLDQQKSQLPMPTMQNLQRPSLLAPQTNKVVR